MRIEPLEPSTTEGAVRTILERVERGAGRVPNALGVLANSPAALEAWWAFERALARGTLPARQREQLALLTASTNGCDYCFGLHATAARHLGLDPLDVEGARTAQASDPAALAVLAFARSAMSTCGAVADEDLDRARDAGLGDGQLLEVLAVVAINTFNNMVNRLAGTEPDRVATG